MSNVIIGKEYFNKVIDLINKSHNDVMVTRTEQKHQEGKNGNYSYMHFTIEWKVPTGQLYYKTDNLERISE